MSYFSLSSCHGVRLPILPILQTLHLQKAAVLSPRVLRFLFFLIFPVVVVAAVALFLLLTS